MKSLCHHFVRSATLTLLLLLAIACFPAARPTPSSSSAGHLTVGGSGSAYPPFNALARAFANHYPQVQVTFDASSQTLSGIRAVVAGTYDIAATARPLDESERLPGLMEKTIALDAVIIAIHPKAKVDALTSSQVRAIYRGDIRTWAELGGSNNEIIVLDRADGETAKIALRQHLFGGDLRITSRATIVSTERDMFDAVSNVPDTIGYFSMSYILSGSKVHGVRIDGVAPSIETLSSGRYPIVRPIGIVVREDRAAAWPLREFLAFLESSEASAILTNEGLSPETKR